VLLLYPFKEYQFNRGLFKTMPAFEDKTEKTSDKLNFDPVEDNDGLSAIDLSKSTTKNRRIATRYVRDDIAVALCEPLPLSFGQEIFLGFVNLMDITGRGIAFSSTKKMRVNKKIILNFKFLSGLDFKINAAIVNRSEGIHYQLGIKENLYYQISFKDDLYYQYGIKFDYYNQEFSEHILKTQIKLAFK
jgi:hypothetical protein